MLADTIAHDALSARMIERAGFRAIGVGGGGDARRALRPPDIGLAGIGDIVAATCLPVMVDGDDGYGDLKAVARMVEVYLRQGVSEIVLEDQ